MNPANGYRRPQRGATLVVAMVLLMALALLAIWSYNSSTTNMRIVGNTQARQEALAAAQAAMNKTISSALFSQAPTTVANTPVTVDVDGDGATDYTANVSPAPSCYRVKAVKSLDLDVTVDADRACMGSSSAQNAGIDGSALTSGDSLCSDSEWNVRVAVNDSTRTQTSVAVNQGVKMRTLSTDAANACP